MFPQRTFYENKCYLPYEIFFSDILSFLFTCKKKKEKNKLVDIVYNQWFFIQKKKYDIKKKSVK